MWCGNEYILSANPARRTSIADLGCFARMYPNNDRRITYMVPKERGVTPGCRWMMYHMDKTHSCRTVDGMDILAVSDSLNGIMEMVTTHADWIKTLVPMHIAFEEGVCFAYFPTPKKSKPGCLTLGQIITVARGQIAELCQDEADTDDMNLHKLIDKIKWCLDGYNRYGLDMEKIFDGDHRPTTTDRAIMGFAKAYWYKCGAFPRITAFVDGPKLSEKFGELLDKVYDRVYTDPQDDYYISQKDHFVEMFRKVGDPE